MMEKIRDEIFNENSVSRSRLDRLIAATVLVFAAAPHDARSRMLLNAAGVVDADPPLSLVKFLESAREILSASTGGESGNVYGRRDAYFATISDDIGAPAEVFRSGGMGIEESFAVVQDSQAAVAIVDALNRRENNGRDA